MSAPVSDPTQLRASVQEKYAAAATAVLLGSQTSCCGGTSAATCCGPIGSSVIVTGNYSEIDTEHLPSAAVLASLGCGNPTALAQLDAGQIVLDLGSGGGIDVLLSAKLVGPTGFVYGLDMTDEMLELAERNRLTAGADNVQFLKGQIEAIPLPDASVDVIISNCVINLAADKSEVLKEAYRVLRPGGRLAVSDVVVQGKLDATVRADMEAWVGCVAGALEESTYLTLLAEAGFSAASIEVTQVYDTQEALGCCGAPSGAADGRVVSGFIRAIKP